MANVRSNSIFRFLALALLLMVPMARAQTLRVAETLPSAPSPAPIAIAPPSKEQLGLLEGYQKRMVSNGQVRAKVSKTTLIGLLGTEKKSDGQILLSKGKVRLDLKIAESKERNLLIVGEKMFWAVTYPPSSLKDAAIQVILGPVKSKKSGSQGFLTLLGKDGFLKSFTVTGVTLADDGEIRYYLQPKQDWVEAKRALLSLVPKKTGVAKMDDPTQWSLGEMKIWDFQDNETSFRLRDVFIEKNPPAKKEFEFSPPKNADVMPVS